MRKVFLFLLSAVILGYLIVIASGFFLTEATKKPALAGKVDSLDTAFLYDFYVSGNPRIEGRPVYGEPRAGITVVAYLDPRSPSSRYFMAEFFPVLKEKYLASGSVAFIPKAHLLMDDIRSRTDRFIYSSSLNCVHMLSKDRYFEVFFRLFEGEDLLTLHELAAEAGISYEALAGCINGSVAPALIEDASEVEQFGMNGISPRLYIGIAGRQNTVLDGVRSATAFSKAVRQAQIQLGE